MWVDELMRIVAGKYRGVILNTFDLDNVRPTTDKVREAVFSKFQFEIVDKKFLDLFGGTGAVGLEALSRGAQSVIVCDDNRDSIALINKNYAKCKIRPNLYRTNFIKTLKALGESNKKFDFIYLDPPFKTNYGQKAIRLIKQYDLLEDNGVIIFEHLKETDVSECEACYPQIDHKIYGTIAVTFYRKIVGDADV